MVRLWYRNISKISWVNPNNLSLGVDRSFIVNIWIENDKLWKVKSAFGFITTIFKASSVISLRMHLHLQCNQISMIVKLQAKIKASSMADAEDSTSGKT